MPGRAAFGAAVISGAKHAPATERGTGGGQQRDFAGLMPLQTAASLPPSLPPSLFSDGGLAGHAAQSEHRVAQHRRHPRRRQQRALSLACLPAQPSLVSGGRVDASRRRIGMDIVLCPRPSHDSSAG
ncbi:hypothetical protein CDD83_623 [Cordyceps sp. RAO-2017]|nr:hypothetical protein CDD83_623 [Cordyceps sp. RAO-2017]